MYIIIAVKKFYQQNSFYNKIISTLVDDISHYTPGKYIRIIINILEILNISI